MIESIKWLIDSQINHTHDLSLATTNGDILILAKSFLNRRESKYSDCLGVKSDTTRTKLLSDSSHWWPPTLMTSHTGDPFTGGPTLVTPHTGDPSHWGRTLTLVTPHTGDLSHRWTLTLMTSHVHCWPLTPVTPTLVTSLMTSQTYDPSHWWPLTLVTSHTDDLSHWWPLTLVTPHTGDPTLVSSQDIDPLPPPLVNPKLVTPQTGDHSHGWPLTPFVQLVDLT